MENDFRKPRFSMRSMPSKVNLLSTRRVVEAFCESGECRRRTGPPQFVHVREKIDVRAERRERSKQQCAITLLAERGREPGRIRRVGVPVTPIFRNLLDVSKPREHRGS